MILLIQVFVRFQEQLNKLNMGLWPLTLEAVKKEISAINNEVVVIEAALLIQANWVEECHEIWSCIIPPDEVHIIAYILFWNHWRYFE